MEKANNGLPAREAASFKKLVKCWEEKQWKIGLRLAKQILGTRGCGEHGETLALKGLLLLGIGRREDAMAEVRRGLQSGLTSARCWHAFGLLCRAERKFGEAIKSFKHALRLEPTNLMFVRDLAVLQVHTRDLEGHLASRQTMFQIAPGQRGSWCGLVVAHHLSGDLDMAAQVMEEFRKSQHEVNRDVMGKLMKEMFHTKGDFAYEHSELLLYQNQILREAGRFDEALDHLEKWGDLVVDRVKKDEARATLLLLLGRKEEAIIAYENLIERNPEQGDYYTQSLTARGEDESSEMRGKTLEAWCKARPKAFAPKLLLLKELQGDKFAEAVRRYLLDGIRKGVPSLLESINFVYDDESKTCTVGEVLVSILDHVGEVGGIENPTCRLWTLHLLSVHASKLGKFDEAIELSDQALAHTPTLLDLYTARGKIHQRMGEPLLAAHWMEEARCLDTADRAVACQAAKYLTRAGRLEEAVAVMGLFTKPGEPVLEYLVETQCSWFLLELAKAHLARKERGEALVRCAQLRDIFQEVEEDQLDFHLFSMYRIRLSHYVHLLRFEDRLRTYGFYEETALLAIRIYLDIFDTRKNGGDSTLESEPAQLSASEEKKLKNKAKKALKKEMESKSKGQGGKQKEKEKVEAECLTPQKSTYVAKDLENVADPLAEATIFLKPLLDLLGDRLTTHRAAFEIALRKEKPLLMLRALQGARRVAASDSSDVKTMEEELTKFQAAAKLSSVVTSVINLLAEA